jgi:hypothetical protein
LARTAPSGTTTWQGTPRRRAGAGRIEREHRIAGAAELERAPALQALGLERQGAAGRGVQRGGAQDRGDAGMGRDARCGIQHVVELRERQGG